MFLTLYYFINEVILLKTVKIIVLCFFVFVLCSYVCLADAKKKKMTTEGGLENVKIVTEIYPPYQFIDDNRGLRGWATERVELLFSQANIDHKIHVYPWARTYKLALTQPNVFIYSLLRTEQRESLFHWIAPLCKVKFSFYRLKKRKDIQVHSFADAKKYLTAVQKEQASSEYLLSLGFKDKENLLISYNNGSFLRMLVHERVDLIVLSAPYIRSLQLKQDLDIKKIEPIFVLDDLSSVLYLASSLDTSQILQDKLRQAYTVLEEKFSPKCQ
jgi:polar amino acid transport system substrate-binding protein